MMKRTTLTLMSILATAGVADAHEPIWDDLGRLVVLKCEDPREDDLEKSELYLSTRIEYAGNSDTIVEVVSHNNYDKRIEHLRFGSAGEMILTSEKMTDGKPLQGYLCKDWDDCRPLDSEDKADPGVVKEQYFRVWEGLNDAKHSLVDPDMPRAEMTRAKSKKAPYNSKHRGRR